MYLFQLEQEINEDTDILHLHSTMYLFQLGSCYLCQYQDIFTFHYVSISTRKIIPLSYSILIFTFHYVSISTHCGFIRHIRRGIYIPLCIYFNGGTNLLLATKNLFTFHYVSISTQSSLSIKQVHVNLHSTMYLFQRSSSLR